MRNSWHKGGPQRNARPSHADDWLMTYADVITLLLCFFAVSFLALSASQKNMRPKVDIPPIAQAEIKQPDIFKGDLPFHAFSQADASTDDDEDQTSGAPVATAQPAPAAPLANPTPAATAPPVSATSAQPATPVNTTPTAPASAPAASLPEIVDHLKPQEDAHIEQKGDRITTLQMSSEAFFASGSATLSASGQRILQDVAANLKSDKFKDYQITVEGHTDDSPISTAQFPSNWELSTARASAVVHFFLDQGISAQKLRAAGYADTFPIAPNRDSSGNPIPANQAKNRRVVIKLEKIDKPE